MKKSIIALTLFGTLTLAVAQERLPREQALKYAAAAGADLGQLKGTPIPSDVDLKQPVVMQEGEFGGMLLPEAKLTAEALAKAGEKIVPIGQLWLLGLAPMADGQVVGSDRLRVASVKHNDTTYKLPQCALGVRRNSAGAMELLVFGKDKEPVLKVALKAVEGKQETPLDMTADRESDSAEITLKVLGKYEAKFKVTQSES